MSISAAKCIALCACSSLVSVGAASSTGETVAVGVGFTWGKGMLIFQGKTYPFTVDGLSAIGAGVTKISAAGTIDHLTSVTDFAGTYAAAGGGASVERTVGTKDPIEGLRMRSQSLC